MSLLEVRALRASYPLRSRGTGRTLGRITVVDGVDLDVEAGRTLALVGESGSGKTTIARSILRLIEPDAGSVRLGGEELLGLPAAEMRMRRRELQMVFQDPWGSFNPRLRVADALFEPLRIHGIAARGEKSARVTQLLREVGLAEDAAERYPHEFSGGQRQRIGIARALATQPAVLIADEPVSALDLSVRGQILNLLSERQAERGLALLLIAHDLVLVGQVADRIAVLYDGRIVEEGSRDAVLESPRHPHTRALLAAVPGVPIQPNEEEATAAGEGLPAGPADLPGCPYRGRCSWARESCHRELPPLQLRAPGHRVACFVDPPAEPLRSTESGTFAGERRRDGRG